MEEKEYIKKIKNLADNLDKDLIKLDNDKENAKKSVADGYYFLGQRETLELYEALLKTSFPDHKIGKYISDLQRKRKP